MKTIFIYFIVLVLTLLSQFTRADISSFNTDVENDGAYLDPQYSHPAKPPFSSRKDKRAQVPRRSPVAQVIGYQTEVKAQAARGTCSIFSATALLESLLVREFGLENSLDLSEEWLEMVTHLNRASEGSSSYSNFSTLAQFGSPREKTFPYIGETWASVEDSYLAKKRCGSLNGYIQKICLVGHRDPGLFGKSDLVLATEDLELLHAKKEAAELKEEYLSSLQMNSIKPLYFEDDVKELLSRGIPVTLDVDFYYGTWNHRKATDLGLKRDMNMWSQGIVTYPAPGSLDISVSRKDPAGHSVVLVGYDDDRVIEVKTQMQDGSVKNFKYKGVYYFKNSWGTGSFGASFELDGQDYPGYGVMTQDYAKDFGTFYQMPLKK